MVLLSPRGSSLIINPPWFPTVAPLGAAPQLTSASPSVLVLNQPLATWKVSVEGKGANRGGGTGEAKAGRGVADGTGRGGPRGHRKTCRRRDAKGKPPP